MSDPAFAHFPSVPDYLEAPVEFLCAKRGAMMLGTWHGVPWLFRVINGAWVSHRPATAEDLAAIQSAPRLGEVAGQAVQV